MASTTGVGRTLLARSVRPLHLVSEQRSPVQVRLGADFLDLQIRGLEKTLGKWHRGSPAKLEGPSFIGDGLM